MGSLLNKVILYKIFLITFAAFLLLINSEKFEAIKLDTLIIVGGNFAIAFLAAKYITSRQKKDELSLDHCIGDITEILIQLKDIKTTIEIFNKSSNQSIVNFALPRQILLTQNQSSNELREIVSQMSILEHLLGMLHNHELIDEKDILFLQKFFKKFEDNITGSKIIHEDWYDNHLKIYRRLLNMKNSVSKKFRK